MYCEQCLPQRYIDVNSGLCLCLPGTYDDGSSCEACSNNCLTCSQLACTSCAIDKYLVGGQCFCRNGNAVGPDGSCALSSSISIGLILGIAIGAGAGLICVITTIVLIRRQNFKIFHQG
jgi:glutaredoxin-related protein